MIARLSEPCFLPKPCIYTLNVHREKVFAEARASLIEGRRKPLYSGTGVKMVGDALGNMHTCGRV
jgi:hypothetical protein